MSAAPPAIDETFLLRHPLPDPTQGGSKHERGTVLIVGATTETPGALLLAGLAALRVGAGRLQIAVPEAVAPLLAVQLPEAQVIGLDEHASGTVRPTSRLAEAMADSDVVLVGPGLGDEEAGRVVLEAAVAAVSEGGGSLVVDAGALVALGRAPGLLAPILERCVAMPNPGEAAALAGDRELDAEGGTAVDQLVERLGCTVALRGPDTWIASPAHPKVVERDGPVGLATSGSGDVLAGMVAGHLARGAEPFDAIVWAVHLHAAAGRALTSEQTELGLLAREVIDALPAVRASAAGRLLRP
ncbi:NAD(P)H-hydrate dehydratase [Aquihabitans daechungensis]|uniref:NAD(P)H-hydrate dehydratase n=1 Tax=Aquihabitans daechungensis TaxID=1052257 RepID=UPI003BA39783